MEEEFEGLLIAEIAEHKVIKCQRIIRKWLIRSIVPSNLQTKNWRKSQTWYKGGKHNECEKWQITRIQSIIKTKLNKTYARLNMETAEMKSLKNPFAEADAFEWTENFDGVAKLGRAKLYFNLKMVCDRGGAQTRSIRETYHFIKTQKKIYSLEIYFINILDGDTCSLMINQLPIPQKNIFIGDLHSFISWFAHFQ